MTKVLHKKLPDRWTLLSGRSPIDEFSFPSDNLQIIYNCTDEPWKDEVAHQHDISDEIYIVMEGCMILEVEGERVAVEAGDYLCMAAGVIHQLVEVTTPVKSFVIRSPSVADKRTVTSEAPI